MFYLMLFMLLAVSLSLYLSDTVCCRQSAICSLLGSLIHTLDTETERSLKSKHISKRECHVYSYLLHRYIMIEDGKAITLSEPFLLQDLGKEAPYDLSLVVPAYNEEQRLPKMMDETVEVSY